MRKNHIEIGLIIILLLVTVYSIYNTNDLKNQVGILSAQISAQESRVANQIFGIENIVNEIKKGNQWYEEPMSPKITFEEDAPKLNLEFKLKEYAKDSTVTFHVRNFHSETFETIKAQNVGNGLYTHEIQDLGTISPIVDFGIYPITSGDMIFEEPSKADYEATMAYYVSVENGGQVTTSDTFHVYMHELSISLYQPLGGNIDVDVDKGLIHTSLDSNTYNPSVMYHAIDKITIQAYKDMKVVEFWKLPKETTENQWVQYMDSLEITKDYDSLYIEVAYEGKDAMHKTVYRKLIGQKK